MLDIQKTQLDKAIQLLTALKCQFAIVTPDGEKLGELEVKPIKVVKARVKTGPRYDYTPFKLSTIGDMQPGDVLQFTVAGTDVPRDSLAGNMSAQGCKHFGPGNFTVEYDKKDPLGCSCMRLA